MPYSIGYYILKKEASDSCETFVTIYQTTLVTRPKKSCNLKEDLAVSSVSIEGKVM